MKKLLRFTLAAALVFALTGCTSAAESGAKNAVNGYFTSLEEGDIDKAQNYVASSVTTDFSSLQQMETSMNTMLEQHSISDATKKLFSDAFKSIVKLCVRSHNITKTEKVSNTEYKVTVDADILSADDISTAIKNIDSNSFLTDISSKVMEKYQSEGEAAAAEYMMSEMAGWIGTNYGDALKNLKPATQTRVFTVDQQDKDWLITAVEN